MADRGLSIEEGLALKLNWQSLFLIKKKSQLDPKIRVIDNVCIQVERVIGLPRQKYNILQRILPIDHLMSTRSSSYPMVDRMIRVCYSLTNLCPSGVPFDRIEHQQTLFNDPCLPIHYSWQILILAENALLGKHDKSLP